MQVTQLEQLVARTLAELLGSPPEGLERSILLREGVFVGYRYRCAGIEAIWLAQDRLVEFYSEQQEAPLRSVPYERLERPAA